MLETNVTVLRPINKVISLIPNSDLSALLSTALLLANAEPHLMTLIDKDLDDHGVEKKKLRIEDRLWVESQSALFPNVDSDDEEFWRSDLQLGVGRPRMPAVMVYIFILIRGYLGGFKDKKTIMLLLESRTLEIFFQNFEYKSPGFSTIIDNVNAINLSTLDAIHDAQIRIAAKEHLDSFKELTFDSTNVRANTAWPTDSSLIMKLSFRSIHLVKKINLFGLTVKIPKTVDDLLFEIKIKSQDILFITNKGDANKKRAKLYRQQYKLATKLLKKLQIMYCSLANKTLKLNIIPSEKRYIDRLIDWLDVDIKNLDLVIDNSKRRINKKEKVPAEEKIFSLSDEDAAMISKGGREPTVGYKPQLGRSANGLVTSLIVPMGNASDSSQLESIVEASIAKTGVLPEILSFDDGYTNSKDRKHYRGLEIEISFSGAKGKRLIPIEEYESPRYKEARNNRSAVESLMFMLKHNHNFECPMRRGIGAIRSELLEKVLVYNFFRMDSLRTKMASKRQAA